MRDSRYDSSRRDRSQSQFRNRDFDRDYDRSYGREGDRDFSRENRDYDRDADRYGAGERGSSEMYRSRPDYGSNGDDLYMGSRGYETNGDRGGYGRTGSARDAYRYSRDNGSSSDRGYQYGQGTGQGTDYSSYGNREMSDYRRQDYGSPRSDYRSSSKGGEDLDFNRNRYHYDNDQDRGRRSESAWERMGEKVGRFFGMGPKGYKRSDDRIREDVNEALYRDYEVDASNIEVDVKDGLVTLSGTVDSRFAKRRAERCVENLSGVKDVSNNIRVQETSSMSSGMSTAASSSTTGKSGKSLN